MAKVTMSRDGVKRLKRCEHQPQRCDRREAHAPHSGCVGVKAHPRTMIGRQG